MNLKTLYRQYRDKWWGLPLILPVVLLPLIRLANTQTVLNGNLVSLYHLPLAFMLSLTMFFGPAAIPGIMLSTWLYMTDSMSLGESAGVIVHFLLPVLLSWAGYRACVPRRQQISHGNVRLMAGRLFWQMFFPSTLFLTLFQAAVYLGLHPYYADMEGRNPLSLWTLIDYQSLLVGCLTGVPICYLMIRIIRNPLHVRGFLSRMRLQFDPKVKCMEMGIWAATLLILLGVLLNPLNNGSTIFSTNYTLSLILPVMLWGSMRYGYRFMSLIWTSVLIVIIHFFQHYLPVTSGYADQLAITSSSYLVFSFIVVYMAMLATRQRTIHARVRRMAFLDPVINIPNLRALSRVLATTPRSVLCFLHVPELELLGRHYGVMQRIQYKQNLSAWLRVSLQPGEDVYHLSGHDLLIRINTEDYQARIDFLSARIKKFRLVWDGIPLQPQVGIGYCYVNSPVDHLHLLLGELSAVAGLSLTTSNPENLQRRGMVYIQQSLKNKVVMMNKLQQALEMNQFQLMVQPIVGVRGDDYYEVLLRMIDEDGTLISPDAFLPVAHEFGLSSRIDLWVLENTLMFMDKHRDVLPGLRLSINLTPSTVSGVEFPKKAEKLLAKYHIEGWQIIFELTESHSLARPDQAQQTMRHLQLMGCRVAIDDFGTGYASYARLKSINADILKIDGSFIRNIVTSSLDYQIVASICNLARMKNMKVVAEYVENEEIRVTAIALGIDYLQGFGIGKPAPLETLVSHTGNC